MPKRFPEKEIWKSYESNYFNKDESKEMFLVSSK